MSQSVDPALWADPAMRAVLARRDIPAVYRMLKQIGLSQRDIAALTGQSQSEVSEILKGRQVMSYDVLARIADGLDVPRGWMGLAYDEPTRALLVKDAPPPQPEEDEDVQRRKFIAKATSIAFGVALGEQGGRFDFIADPTRPPPNQIGRSDVAGLQALTRELRKSARGGHPGMPEIYQPVAQRLEPLLEVNGSDFTHRKLRSALAELHNDAGWYAYDMHLTDLASWHYSRAIKLGTEAGDTFAAVRAAWSQANGYRELGAPSDALKLYQLALERLERSMTPGRETVLGDLHLRIALAFAELAAAERPVAETPSPRGLVVVELRSNDLHEQVKDAVSRAGQYPQPSTNHDISQTDTAYTHAGIELALGRLDTAAGHAMRSLDLLNVDHRRNRAFVLTRLATIHTMAGERDAPELAATALGSIAELRSARGRALLAPLGAALVARKDSTSADLAQRVRAAQQS